MRWFINKKIILGFGSALVILTAIGLVALFNLTRYLEASQGIEHTHRVLETSEELFSQLTVAETSQRGYILTGDEQFLKQYHSAAEAVRQKLDELWRLLADSQAQQHRLDALKSLVSDKLSWAEYVIGLRREQGLQMAVDVILSGLGMQLTNAILQLVEEIHNAEERLLVQRSKVAGDRARVGTLAIISGSMLAFVMLLLAGWMIVRDQRALHEARAELERRVEERTADLRDTLAKYAATLEQLQTLSQELEMVNEELRRQNQVLAASQNSLSEQRQRYLELFNFAPDGYLVTDPEGIVQEVNLAAGRLLGVDAEALVGETLTTFVHDEDRSILLDCFGQISRRDQSTDCEARFHTRIGTTFWAAVTLSAVRGGQGQLTGLRWLLRDITERRHAEEAVRRERDFAESLIQTAQAIVLVLDAEGRIVRFNRFMEKLSGYRLVDVQGRDWFTTFLPERDREPTSRLFSLALSGDPLRGVVNTLITRDGQERDIEWASTTLKDIDGNTIGILSIGHDVTERRRIDRLKAEFISTVSHELRTPLTSIAGSLGLLKGGVAGELTEQARTLVEIACRNSKRLVLLINDLLDIDKIESGTATFTLQPVELMPVVEEAIEMNRGYADQFGVRLVLGGRVPGVKVNVDTSRLLQVLTNLLSNAAKFSPPNGIVVISVMHDRDTVRVTVTDHGPGIPEEFRDRVFQKFSQADASDSRAKGGTGLGLSISKAIVERFGGSIGFDTSPDQGTTFYFDLPEWKGTSSLV